MAPAELSSAFFHNLRSANEGSKVSDSDMKQVWNMNLLVDSRQQRFRAEWCA